MKIKMSILSYSSLLKEGYSLDKTKYNELKIDNKAMSIILFTSGTTKHCQSCYAFSICYLYGFICFKPDDRY